MWALFTSILGAPAAIEALLKRVDALETLVAGFQKEQESDRINLATHDSTNAQTSDDVEKAAHEAADATAHL